jgi:hypothetical protein
MAFGRWRVLQLKLKETLRMMRIPPEVLPHIARAQCAVRIVRA